MALEFKNGKKIARVSQSNDGYGGTVFYMSSGIRGEVGVDGGFQVFDMRPYTTQERAIKAAKKWINS